jgi:hypothetical protein
VVSNIIVTPQPWVLAQLTDVLNSRTGRIEDIDWPLEREIRRVLAPRHRFDPSDRNAIAMWDTTLQTLMFGRMIEHMKVFFTVVGVVTLSLGGLGVMNIMLVAVPRAHPRDRRAQGARRHHRQRAAAVLPRGLHPDDAERQHRIRRRARVVFAHQPAADAHPLLGHGHHHVGRPGRRGGAGGDRRDHIHLSARRAALLPPVEALRYEGH